MCLTANIVSPFQGFDCWLGISAVGCTDGYYCNAPSVLYSGNIICLKSRRDDIIVESCNAKPYTLKSRRDDTTITTCEAGGKQTPHTSKPRSGDILKEIRVNPRCVASASSAFHKFKNIHYETI
ncbi:MAG: hypothetical protein A2X02_00390 [Bacteroidetes bacterium GWF2_29_10]|nr:MAG: hypothetical protein A2X02_00390 [Bacteroidetes bacterium GWF2_29_10]